MDILTPWVAGIIPCVSTSSLQTRDLCIYYLRPYGSTGQSWLDFAECCRHCCRGSSPYSEAMAGIFFLDSAQGFMNFHDKANPNASDVICTSRDFAQLYVGTSNATHSIPMRTRATILSQSRNLC